MIRLEGVGKAYDLGRATVRALDGVELSIARGELVTIMGPSGSGKSTLLHIMGILDRPTSGRYLLEGHDVQSLRDREKARIRVTHFGFVFQSFNLFGELSALENVMVPLMYAGVGMSARRRRAAEALERVGMSHRLAHYPAMLSGGEQQRVAIARALVNGPDLILADEPTGNLPAGIGREIIAMLREINDAGTTVVLVTHDESLGRSARRRIGLADGAIVRDENVTEEAVS